MNYVPQDNTFEPSETFSPSPMTKAEKRARRKELSIIAWGFFALIAVSFIGQTLLSLIFEMMYGSNAVIDAFITGDWFIWVITYVPLYFIGFPLFLGIVSAVRSSPCIPPKKLHLS